MDNSYFPGGGRVCVSKKRKSSNDDEHGHGPKKRKPLTYVEGITISGVATPRARQREDLSYAPILGAHRELYNV